MKALCTEYTTPNASFQLTSGKVSPGTYYTIEDATGGTGAQNRTLHPLVMEFYRWMLSRDEYLFEVAGAVYDFTCSDWQHLKDILKYRYGEGFCRVKYVDENYSMQEVKKIEDVPDYALQDLANGNRGRVQGILKSWSDYTKRQRMNLISNIIDIMKLIGVDSKKFHDILDEIEGE